MEIQPLTRRNAMGVVYQRLPEVEQQLGAALALGPGDLVARASIPDYRAPGYLQEECLVYLIREYHRQCQEQLVTALSQILLHRSAKFINGQLQSLPPERVNEAYREVITGLFTRILAVDDDRGDFLQVRFWKALDRLTKTAFTNQTKDLARSQKLTPWPNSGEAETGDDDRRMSSSLGAMRASVLSPEWHLAIREALSVLPEPQRSAFILSYYDDWPIDSTDANVPTISKYFGKTPRTIHNWLKQAERILQLWREGGEER
jgi:hypothetical protein